MALGELFLSAFLQVLFDRLASPELLNFARREGLLKKLYKWEKTLSVIKAVLDDAEEKQHIDRAVRKWLDDLRDLAYDVEDILDEFVTEALYRKLIGENQASTSKVRNLIPTCFSGLTPSAFRFNISLGLKIKEITARFNNIATQKDQLNLKGTVDGSSNRRRWTEYSTSLVNEAGVFGREKDVEAILNILLNEVCIPANLSVIPIIGMGGIGKTTLAQLVYNDEKVQGFFDLKAWACVSEDFNVARLTKIVLESDTSEIYDRKDLNWLQENLKKKLHGKRFLIIWMIFGMRITITGLACVLLSKQGLPEVLLSSQLAIRKLHHWCKGLPLAAKTLGGLLRTKQDRDDWEEVLHSKIWNIPEERSRIVPALMLSYHHLPAHLKRCFAYCSIFPKDYEFEEKEVVLLWMAEGLIQPREEEKQMEDLGSKYFRDLVSRSLFQQSTKDTSQYLMHDLISDLAQSIVEDTCFRMDDRVYDSKGHIYKKVRHLSYLGGRYDGANKFEVVSKLPCLRTFLPLRHPYPGNCYLTSNVPLQLLPKLTCLRVVSLRGYRTTKISDSIGDLKHLRYLDLSYTAITGMPESTTTLYNLQTLLLENCSQLVKLPSLFANLVNLRHLNILGASSLEGIPPEIGKLTYLQTLSNLIVGKGSCSGVKELGSLSHLRGTLCISGLENVIKSRDAMDANLIGMSNLSGLLLEWSSNIGESQDRTMESEVLNNLQPHNGLKELTIRHYGGTKFPTWLRGAPFPNMLILTIENCRGCTSLPPVGQLPSLKVLSVKGLARVKNVGLEFYGEGCHQPFKSLETLHFDDMVEWENWCPCEEFPSLRELSIKRCPKLWGKLPNLLPLLNKLVVINCTQLMVLISRFPALCEIRMEDCKGLVSGNNVCFRSLRSAYLTKITESESHIEGLTHVEDLTIANCEEVLPLWSNNVGLLQHLPCLRSLSIRSCPKLVSLVMKEVEEQLQLGVPSKVAEIRMSDCNALESLPKAMMYHNSCLEYIVINDCSSLTYFAIGELPPTLRRLWISFCNNMRIVLAEEDDTSRYSSTSLLQELVIIGCPSLESLTSSGELPSTLRFLDIKYCDKLESIAKSLRCNSVLENINIDKCENLVPFPEAERELLPPNLRLLSIFCCEKVQALPNGIHNLSSLQALNIGCPGIASFPKEGFPTNLTSLHISDLKITEALFEWGLHRLTSLKRLVVRGGCLLLVSFPTPEMMLPASLTCLSIASLPNLEYLSSEGFRRLAFLEELFIRDCKKLMSFPEDGLPPSLLELQIDECEMLKTLPNNGLPLSLLQLCIRGCPLLKERCMKDQGRDWSKIAHIPYVVITD
ncbi:putative disease resistance RPP13-like protein 1 [Morella rubra]|uniref:Putative disease resistance RPP13-like protein 1 n=1 Tax=Morella rubra TaxID=262757 RepID=A0A6A1WM55_9ROSI|nr:putative disease resistance RPP13-like protein 1 [Morella rubra]